VQLGIGALIGAIVLIILIVGARALEHIIKREREIQTVRQREIDAIRNMAMMGECTGNVCHEIATPLAVVALTVEHGEENLEELAAGIDLLSPADLKKLVQENILGLQKIVKNLKRVEDIITATRNLYRKDVASMAATNLNVADIATEVMDYAKDRIRKSGVPPIEVRIPASCRVEGRRIQMVQVLVNLIHNASDAVASYEEKWIRIEASEVSSGVVISVVDSGKGIPATIVEKILDEGFTTKKNGQGTGLGLRLCRSMVESWGGKLTYNMDSPNTRFDIFIPRTDHSSNPASAA
jgi:two-component system C4-dicarboxylate transport sensor histidine kinase DctB